MREGRICGRDRCGCGGTCWKRAGARSFVCEDSDHVALLDVPSLPQCPLDGSSAAGPFVSGIEFLADNAADALPRCEHGPPPAKPHARNPAQEKRAH